MSHENATCRNSRIFLPSDCDESFAIRLGKTSLVVTQRQLLPLWKLMLSVEGINLREKSVIHRTHGNWQRVSSIITCNLFSRSWRSSLRPLLTVKGYYIKPWYQADILPLKRNGDVLLWSTDTEKYCIWPLFYKNRNYSKTCLRDPLNSETTSHLRPQFRCTNSLSCIFNLSSETTL